MPLPLPSPCSKFFGSVMAAFKPAVAEELCAPGKNMTFEFALFAMACIASRYRICIAGAEDRMSAA